MTGRLLMLSRRLVFLLGCLVLLALAVRMASPEPRLEMAEEACAGSTARPGAMAGLRQLAARLLLESPNPLEGDWALLCKYRQANRNVMRGPPVRVVMIGDSITQYWMRENPELLGEGIINRGIAGQTSTQVLVRFQQDAVALRPAIVHIMAGLNDIAGNTGRITPQDYKNNMTAMIDMARANGMTVVLGGITPARNFHWRKGVDPSRRIVELNGWLAETARARGLVYADYHRVLADARGYPIPELDSDGSHPNAQGFAAMKPVLEAALAQAEARLKAPSAGPI